MIKKNLFKILSILVIPIMLYSCAAEQRAINEIIWPLPPDIPRVKFLKSYYGPSDVVKKSFIADAVLGGSGYVSFSKPMGVHYDNGRLFVVDTGKLTVFMLDKKNQLFKALSIRGRQAFRVPVHMAIDSKGNIIVVDAAAAQIIMFDSNGNYLKHVFRKDKWTRPTGITIDKKRHRIYIADTQKHKVRVYDDRSHELLQTIGGIRGTGEGEMNFPTHMTVNKNNGDLLVTDTMNARVQIFDYKGRFKLAFGQFGDGPGMFSRPKGIAVDSEDHIYVADAGFNNIQIFDYEGRVLLAFSGYGQERGHMILPAGLFIDDDDVIYVSDSFNERINLFEFLGDKHKARKSKGINLDK
jgi:DNA-binding beta-propeller fold protein YncE